MLPVFTLRLGSYEALDRSRIIYNHLWPSLVKEPSLVSAALLEACHRLLRLVDFTPGIAVRHLQRLLSHVGEPAHTGVGVTKDEVESDVEADPILSRLRHGWVAAPRDSDPAAI